jgi:hypothetical protein
MLSILKQNGMLSIRLIVLQKYTFLWLGCLGVHSKVHTVHCHQCITRTTKCFVQNIYNVFIVMRFPMPPWLMFGKCPDILPKLLRSPTLPFYCCKAISEITFTPTLTIFVD